MQQHLISFMSMPLNRCMQRHKNDQAFLALCHMGITFMSHACMQGCTCQSPSIPSSTGTHRREGSPRNAAPPDDLAPAPQMKGPRLKTVSAESVPAGDGYRIRYQQRDVGHARHGSECGSRFEKRQAEQKGQHRQQPDGPQRCVRARVDCSKDAAAGDAAAAGKGIHHPAHFGGNES